MDPLAALGLFKDRTFRVVSQLVDRVKELERENDEMSEENERLQNELAEHKLLAESLLHKQRITTAALVKLYKEHPSNTATAKQLRCVGSGGGERKSNANDRRYRATAAPAEFTEALREQMKCTRRAHSAILTALDARRDSFSDRESDTDAANTRTPVQPPTSTRKLTSTEEQEEREESTVNNASVVAHSERLTLSRPPPLFIPSTHYGGAPIQHESPLHISPHETTQSPPSSLVAVSVATRNRKYSAAGTQQTKLRVCLSNAQRRRQFHAFLKAEYVGRDR